MDTKLDKYSSKDLVSTDTYNKLVTAHKKEQQFQEKANEFTKALIAKGCLVREKAYKDFPVNHRFADGLYIREWESQPNCVGVTEIHAQSNPIFLLEGDVTFLTEFGAESMVAPWYTITAKGTQRILYTHTKAKFVTVHRTDLLDDKSIRKHLCFGSYKEIVKDFPEVEQLKKMIKTLGE